MAGGDKRRMAKAKSHFFEKIQRGDGVGTVSGRKIMIFVPKKHDFGISSCQIPRSVFRLFFKSEHFAHFSLIFKEILLTFLFAFLIPVYVTFQKSIFSLNFFSSALLFFAATKTTPIWPYPRAFVPFSCQNSRTFPFLF